MEVKIDELDHKGNGIGRIDGKVVFVPKSLPDEEVLIEIIKSHKKYDCGKIVKVLSKSEYRIDSLCPNYELCGGCNISNLNYAKQLEYKKNKVINIFNKYLKKVINPEIIGSDKRYEYRNKITFRCADGKLGLVDINDNFMEIDKCYLVSEEVNELYDLLKDSDLSKVKKIVIRECDNGLQLNIDGNMEINKIRDLCLSIYMNGDCLYKMDDGYINIKGIKYKVSLDSFFQINTCNIDKLYDVILEYGEFKNTNRVIDLYCGVGSISLYVSRYVKEVLGIEIVADAVNDAWENARINNIDNVNFICGDVTRLIDDNIDGDVIIVDPPRIGLSKHAIDVLNKRKIDKIIYVSCDPMTLVRDLGLLDNYHVDKITLVDMFPQTSHVECVCVLRLK